MTTPTIRVATHSHRHGVDTCVVGNDIAAGHYSNYGSADQQAEIIDAFWKYHIHFEPDREEYIDVVDLDVHPLAIPKPQYVVIVWDEDMALVDITSRTVLAHVVNNHVMHYPSDVPSTTIRDRDIPNPEEPGAPNWTDVINNLGAILEAHPPRLK